MESKGVLIDFNEFISKYLFFLDRRDGGKHDRIRCNFCKKEVYTNGVLIECCDKMKSELSKQERMRAERRKEDEKHEKVEKESALIANLAASGLEGSEVGARFKNYDATNEAQQYNVALCHSYCKGKAVVLILAGSVGTGKTHLAIATAKTIAFHGKKTFGILRCSKIYDNKSEDFQEIVKKDILIIDDIGREGGSEARSSSRIAFIANIIEDRMRKRKKTIFTTNLKIWEIREKYGSHILDRILESSMIPKMRMDFDSYRTSQK